MNKQYCGGLPEPDFEAARGLPEPDFSVKVLPPLKKKKTISFAERERWKALV